MGRNGRMAFMALLLILGGAVFAAPSEVFSPTKTLMRVQVEKTLVRAAPTVTAAILAEVPYRTALEVTATGGGWARVVVPGSGAEGYVFLSALTAGALTPSAPGAAERGVTGTEIVLAGKGFAESMEQSYSLRSGIDFSWVDYMESFGYPASDCVRFLAGE